MHRTLLSSFRKSFIQHRSFSSQLNSEIPTNSKFLTWILTCSGIGGTIGAGYGIKYSYDYSYPNVEDIIMPPVIGLGAGTGFGFLIGSVPPLIPIYGYLTYHHRHHLFPQYFDTNSKFHHP